MNDSVGARLRQARELRRLTLPQVSESTKVRTHYLQALENDDLSAIPSAAQARGFLHIYAEFLELDLERIMPPAPAVSVPAAPAPDANAIPVQTAPSARPSLWDSLRQRLMRGTHKETLSTTPTADIPEPAPVAAESIAAPNAPVQEASSLPGSADVKTKASGRSKAVSAGGAATDLKKNAGS